MAMVRVEKPRPQVSLITLDDPDTLNSMSFGLVGDLYAALETVAADNETAVVILTGTRAPWAMASPRAMSDCVLVLQ